MNFNMKVDTDTAKTNCDQRYHKTALRVTFNETQPLKLTKDSNY